MSKQDDFFTPEEVDRQIEQISRLQQGEQADAEALAYLRSLYGTSSQQEQETLNRIWSRIINANHPLQQEQQQRQERVIPMQNQPASINILAVPSRQRFSLIQRLGLLAAAILLVALVGSTVILFSTLRQNSGSPKPNPNTTTVISKPTAKPTAKPVPFKVTSISMSVTPGSIAGLTCGTVVTVKYKATIHVLAHGPGGKVHFGYTTDNGRSQNTATVTFAAGQTSKSYTFTWSGALPADHTEPEQGGIQVTSPNHITSALVAPTGTCVSEAAFAVTSIDMAVSPASIAGLACGTTITVTYTATIHVAANSPGGTIDLSYTTDNGRGQTPASLTFAAGQTIGTYAFTWSGALPPDHTSPGPGGIQVTSPNLITSALVAPTGTCQ